MHRAALKGHEAVVELLLAAGASINVSCRDNGEEVTAVQLACKYDLVEIAVMLIEAGAEVRASRMRARNGIILCFLVGWMGGCG